MSSSSGNVKNETSRVRRGSDGRASSSDMGGNKPDAISSCLNPWFAEDRANNGRSFVGDDADLAREMNELSVDERERVYDDVHGCVKEVEETPEFIQQCLEEFDQAIAKLPVRQRKLMNRANFLRPKLENDQEFKLSFLRSDEYDADKAAKRLAKYYDQKCELFGEEKVAKKITISDLSEKDLDVFRSGYVVVLPVRDQAGRPVLFADATKIDFDRMALDSICRCYWYLQTTIVFQDEVAQKKGVCAVFYISGGSLSMTEHIMGKVIVLAKKGSYVLRCLPIRYTAFHFCYDDRRMVFLINTLRAASGKEFRLRFKVHLGSQIENEYTLMTFGIKVPGLLQKAKTGDTSIHQQYIQQRYEIDRIQHEEEVMKEKMSGIVATPTVKDVLIGRGQPFRDYVGNDHWNQLVSDKLDRYLAGNHRFEKARVAMEVVDGIHNNGGRILQRDNDDGWKVLDGEIAREKAAIAFRTRSKSRSTTNDTSNAQPLSFRVDSPQTDDDDRDFKRFRSDPSPPASFS